VGRHSSTLVVNKKDFFLIKTAAHVRREDGEKFSELGGKMQL
jgi:hypothetical protein